MSLLRHLFVVLTVLFACITAHAVRISDIVIEGTQRIEQPTILSYLTIKKGEEFDALKLEESLKNLFATGLFTDIVIKQEGSTLVVKVKENPIINRIAFEGNKKVETKTLEKEVLLKPRIVYTATKVQNDVQRVLDIYRRSGRFAATVEPKIIELDQNRVDLIFEIDEGPKTGVQRIIILGNKHYSDSKIQSVISTKETRWYRFLSNDDTYDPDRLNYDKELMRRFYLNHGYADFRVLSAVAELTEDKKDFFITFTVDEGERYQFGEIDIKSDIPNLDLELLKKDIITKTGDWYKADDVEETIDDLTTAVENQLVPFVDISPRVKRDRDAHVINITYDIRKGEKLFVQEININGNSRTIDKVIRREITLAEGDPFNNSKVSKSKKNLQDLDYFEEVEITRKEGADQDQTILDVHVQEKSTGALTVGGAFSSVEGPMLDFGFEERNLMGTGKDIRFSTRGSKKTKMFDISLTEPYFLDRKLAAGIDLFHTRSTDRKDKGYDVNSTGAALRIGYDLSEHLRQHWSYTIDTTRVNDFKRNAPQAILNQPRHLFMSIVGHHLIYDRRDSRIDPTEGWFVGMANDIAGAGGNTRFFRNKLHGAAYYPVYDQVIASLTGEAAVIKGIGQKVALTNRYFMGGDDFRGFDYAGVGPRVVNASHSEALGGRYKINGRAQLSFPIGLPDEFKVKGQVFSDFGSLWGAQEKTIPGVETVYDSKMIRVSSGAGISWVSPMGGIQVGYAHPVRKAKYDDTKRIYFNFGTQF